MKTSHRLQKLRQRFAEKEIDAILISQPENRYYLSGFDGSAGYLLITPQEIILATDFRYVDQAKKQAPDYKIFQVAGEIGKWFPELLAGLNINQLGFESEHTTFAGYRKLTDIINKAQLKLNLVPVNSLVESLRAVKDPEEIEFITRAAEISDRAFEYVRDRIKIGMTEIEIAWEIERFMRENGSQAIPFEIIVASGERAALPHARPSPRAVGSGETVLIDIGARYEGYSSDLTRTICLGTPDDTFAKIYDTVLGAQMAVIAIINAGMSGSEADQIARTIIEEAGYGKAFGHGLGHGVGLVIHELPRLGPNSSDELINDMVFTIEPGIYLAGWGGIRIEDTIIMENGTIKIVSKSRKD